MAPEFRLHRLCQNRAQIPLLFQLDASQNPVQLCNLPGGFHHLVLVPDVALVLRKPFLHNVSEAVRSGRLKLPFLISHILIHPGNPAVLEDVQHLLLKLQPLCGSLILPKEPESLVCLANPGSAPSPDGENFHIILFQNFCIPVVQLHPSIPARHFSYF